MPSTSRPASAALVCSLLLAAGTLVDAVDVWTVGIDNTRQGWNRFETVLTAANVPKLTKIREFTVDDKIDVSPLVVGNRLYVFSMTNTAYIFDVDTGAEIARRQLAPPFDPRPDPGQMDRWVLYHHWGITATPVIDVAANTLYVTTFGKPNANSPNTERNNMLWILDAATLADAKPPVLIAGNADNGGGISNGFTTPYQKMRAGLGLLTDADGNKAVVISFSINGENPRGPGHGFVVAYDVRGLNREPGFAPMPAIWNVTPDGGAGGVWMSGSGPAIDGRDLYLATGNGMDPGTKAGNFGECFVKLRYTPGVAGVANGKPTLVVADYWGAFTDFGRVDEDQDLGAAGVVLIPERGNLLGGGKDGILYNLDKDNLGKDSWTPQFNLPFVATYLPNAPNGPAGLPTTTAANPNWPIVNRDRNLPGQTPTGKSHHIHGTPVYMETARNGIVFLWGENERLKAYNFDFATRRITGFRGEGTQVASGDMPPPGGMPGGRLVVSSNGTTPGTAVVWGVYPTKGNANAAIVPGALVAYDPMVVNNGKLKQLFHSDANPANTLGNFAKYSTPVVANGRVYVGTFSNKVVQYGLAGTRGVKSAPASAAVVQSSPEPAAAPRADAASVDIGALTFGCAKTGLDAAARAAAAVPSRGTYQFSYFNIVNDSHHALYEVHFKSNYVGEPELKYCVSVYCQQGWDPKTTRVSVQSIGSARDVSRSTADVAACAHHAPSAVPKR